LCTPCRSGTGDYEYWSITNVGLKINKNWQFTFEEKLTFGDNAGKLTKHESDFGLAYKGLADWLDLGFNFKKGYERDDDHWTDVNVVATDLKFRFLHGHNAAFRSWAAWPPPTRRGTTGTLW
jgi:hypothetical protein